MKKFKNSPVEFTIKLLVSLLVMVIWSVIGFLLWIPLLFRITVLYCSVVASSMFVETPIAKAEQALNYASVFYIRGFKKNLNLIQYSEEINTKEELSIGFGELCTVSINIFWSMFFWAFFISDDIRLMLVETIWRFLEWLAIVAQGNG